MTHKSRFPFLTLALLSPMLSGCCSADNADPLTTEPGSSDPQLSKTDLAAKKAADTAKLLTTAQTDLIAAQDAEKAAQARVSGLTLAVREYQNAAVMYKASAAIQASGSSDDNDSKVKAELETQADADMQAGDAASAPYLPVILPPAPVASPAASGGYVVPQPTAPSPTAG